MIELEFRSGLAAEIKSLIAEKNALGYPYEQSSRHLAVFDAVCAERFPGEDSLTREMAMTWAKRREGEHPNSQIRRISPVRALAEHMDRKGLDAFVIPRGVPAHEVDYVPYIYTRAEIAALIGAADDMASSARMSRVTKRMMLPCVIRLLYATGMRHGEARMLKRADVDLDSGEITVRPGKNGSGRLVYVSDEVAGHLARYDDIAGERDWFFAGATGNHPASSWLQQSFLALKYLAGVEEPGVTKRVHDIRHTFCVHRLDDWVREGRDVNAMLPYLSAYIGHSSVEATDYYLHLVPEFYGDFAELTAHRANAIPDLGEHHE